jgi:hypothetical protein
MRSSVGGPIITLGTDPLDRQMDRGPFDYLSRWSISQAVKFRRATLRRQRQMQHAKPRSFSFNQTRPPTWYFCGTYFLYYSNINPLSPPLPPCFCKIVAMLGSVNQSNTITARARSKRESVFCIFQLYIPSCVPTLPAEESVYAWPSSNSSPRLTSSSVTRTYYGPPTPRTSQS